MSRVPRVPRSAPLFPRFARALVIVVGLAPWLVAPARALLPLGRAGEVLDALFIPMCHRLPARTLILGGVLMPLCSRCAGIFAGLSLGAIVARPRLPLRGHALLFAASSAAMFLDVVTQDAGLHPVWHVTRLLSGALFGYVIGAATIVTIDRAALPDSPAGST